MSLVIEGVQRPIHPAMQEMATALTSRMQAATPFPNIPDYHTVRHQVNGHLSDHFESRNSLHPLQPNERELRQVLIENLLAFRNRIRAQSPNDYPSPKAYTDIVTGYAHADAFAGTHDSLARTVARVQTLPGPFHIVSDCDGTITLNPKDYLTNIPASDVAEQLLDQYGRGNFTSIFVPTWQTPLFTYPDAYKAAAKQDNVKLRDGLEDMASFVQKENARLSIVSANFAPFVESVLEQTPFTDASIYAVQHDSINATHKRLMLRHLAQLYPENPVIYIGDGSSDKPAAKPEAANVVACYFALEGSEFATELQKANLPYFTYNSFTDITDVLKIVSQNRIPAAKA